MAPSGATEGDGRLGELVSVGACSSTESIGAGSDGALVIDGGTISVSVATVGETSDGELVIVAAWSAMATDGVGIDGALVRVGVVSVVPAATSRRISSAPAGDVDDPETVVTPMAPALTGAVQYDDSETAADCVHVRPVVATSDGAE